MKGTFFLISSIIFLLGLIGIWFLLIVHESYTFLFIPIILPIIFLSFLKKNEIPIYLFALGLNYLSVSILTFYFVLYHDSPFTIIDLGDDALFYHVMQSLGSDFVNGSFSSVIYYSHYSGFGFIIIGAFIDFMLTSFGGIDAYSMKITNAIIGAFIPVLIYKLSVLLNEKKTYNIKPTNIAVYVALFPALIYYSSVGHRDIWLALFSIILLYSLFARYYGKLLVIVLMLLLSFLFRPYSSYVLLLITIIFYFLKFGYKFKGSQKYLVGGLVIILGFIALYNLAGNYLVTFQSSIENYAKHVSSESDSASLGMQLYSLPSPISELSRIVYGLYIPIPPITSFRIDSFFLLFGHVTWYYIIAIVLYYIVSRMKLVFSETRLLIILIYIFLLVFGISMSSLDFRHKTALYPIGIMLCAFFVSKMKNKEKVYLISAYSLFLIFMFFVYAGIKYM